MAYVLYKKLNLDICIIIDKFSKNDIKKIKQNFKITMNQLVYTYWDIWINKFRKIEIYILYKPNNLSILFTRKELSNNILYQFKYNHRYINNEMFHPIYNEIRNASL